MGRTKQTFNVNELFLAGQCDADTRMKLIRSPLFGIVTNMYNRARSNGKQIRVGFINTHSLAFNNGVVDVVKEVNIVSTQGVPIAMITNGSPSYNHIGIGIYGSHAEDSPARALTSSNPKYVQNKFSVKSEHDVARTFDRAVTGAYEFFNVRVRGMLDGLVDNLYGERVVRAPNVDAHRVGNDLVTFLLRMYAGERTPVEMPMDMRITAEANLRNYREQRQKFDAAIANAKEFMDGEKWLYVDNINKGVILGAIKPEPCHKALDVYSESALPYYGAYEYVSPEAVFQWYPSFNDIPEETRKQLEFSMVMLKTHRNSHEMLPQNTGDEKFWLEMGCYSQTSWGGHGASVHVLSK